MNRTFLRALGLLGLAAGTVSGAYAQFPGWIGACIDPTVMDPKPYSDDYGANGVEDQLFGAQIGLGGTVNFSKVCFPPNGFTAQMAGRISFHIGDLGSVQTNEDDDLNLIMGGGFISLGGGEVTGGGSGGNWSIAKLIRQDTPTSARTNTLFGSAAIDTFFTGASDRYTIAESTLDDTRVSLRIDVIGDAARVQWSLTNNNAAARYLGLWFGQWVRPLGNYDGVFHPIQFVQIPGYKPLTVMRRFVRNPNLSANSPREFPMPPYVNFMETQAHAWNGLQVVTSASNTVDGPFGDQTPVDGIDVGYAGMLLGSITGNGGEMPDVVMEDWDFIEESNQGGPGYLQKWEPQAVGPNTAPQDQRTRTIVAYYHTTWGDSDYAKPFTAVADTPKVIATADNNPYAFQKNAYQLRVYVDNTRGYSSVEKEFPLDDVRITLNLPQGMADVNDATRRQIVKYISRVNPKQMSFVDFQFQVLPTAFGALNYSVSIEPISGGGKTVTGTMNVGTQARLLIRDQANLVTAPWVFASNNWSTILSKDPNDPTDIGLNPDTDFQAFAWDSAAQQYVLQTGPQRGFGTWIISNTDAGFKKLNGGPQTPPDLGSSYPYSNGGAPLIRLKPGWNLIANPYNYAIPLGQIVGVSVSNPRDSLTYRDLINQNVISSSLAYWDQVTQSYRFIGDPSDNLQPNTGYWINVLTAQDLTLEYPPVFMPFIPEGTGGIRAAKDWRLNLVAREGSALDDQNFLGFATPDKLKVGTIYEPPIAPVANAIQAFFKTTDRSKTVALAQQVAPEASRTVWNYVVKNKRAGTVQVTWPNIKLVPSDYSVSLYDKATGKTYDMRTTGRFAYVARTRGSREFTITVQNQSNAGPLLDSVKVVLGRLKTDPITIDYKLNEAAKTTIEVINRSGSRIAYVVKGRSDGAGENAAQWLHSRVSPGYYAVKVTVVDESGRTEFKMAQVLVR